MESKTFKSWLILNWKNGTFRCTKKKNKIKPYEIAIMLNLKVNIPEETILQANGEINLSDSKIKEIAIEELDS
jgi:hypothetical protein